MAVELKTKDLQAALKIVKPAIDMRGNVPNLKSVSFRQVDGCLGVSATNLDLSVRIRMKDVVFDLPALNISAERLLAYTGLLDDDTVKFSQDKKGFARMSSGVAKAVLPTFDMVPDFAMPERNEKSFEIDEVQLRRALQSVEFAVSEEESRYTLQGVLLKTIASGTIEVVATDGHRISVYKMSGYNLSDAQVLLPKAMVAAMLQAMNGERVCVITESEKAIAFSIGSDVEIYSSKMCGMFPNYEAVMPKQRRNRLAIDSSRALRSFMRVQTLADSKSHCVVTTFGSNQITLKAADSSAGEGEESIDADAIGAVSETVKTGFRGDYISDFLKLAAGRKVDVDFGKSNEVTVFETLPADGETLTYGVMPMRV